PLREAPKVMARMIMTIDEPLLFAIAAVGMGVVLVEALRRRRLPVEPAPFLCFVVSVIRAVWWAEIARDYPLRVRYLLPVAVVIAIEAAVALVAAGRALQRRPPGPRAGVISRTGIVAAYGVLSTVSRAPQVHTPVLPFVQGG